MNFFDIFILARTKLRSHRVRTGITVAIAGLLFGLIIALVTVIQGVFTSVGNYSNVGLNNRTLINVGYSPQASSFNEYEHLSDSEFVKEVETTYKADIANKQAIAKKYSVEYDPASSDPSPIGTDPITKQKVITNDGAANLIVQRIAQQRRDAVSKKFSISDFLKPYKTAELRTMRVVQPASGALTYMKSGQENQQVSSKRFEEQMATQGSGTSLTILDESVSKPFIVSTKFDPAKGEVPVILPFSGAEKLLGLSQLSKDASSKERQERMRYVRAHVGDITASFCYRNEASRVLLGQAVAQQDELKRAAGNKDYVKPTLLYSAPGKDDCSPITIQSDTRSATEKQAETNRVLFEKETGAWLGEPMQRKVVVRGVGISGDDGSAAATLSAGTLATSLLNSTLGFGTWSVPQDLFNKLPADARPGEIFDEAKAVNGTQAFAQSFQSYLVEFSDRSEARALLERTGAFTGSIGEVSAFPFGSGTLFVDEMRTWVGRALFWVLLAIGAIAVIVLWGVIGRTIADSRRESAVFRAIGATRLDIATVYGLYAVLLSLRVVLFACVLGLGLALLIDLLFSGSATLEAQLAYAAVDTHMQFHFFGLESWYLLAVVGVIVLAGMVASIVPIILGSRRNPIGDMRDE